MAMADSATAKKKKVCVTGAGGFIASWLVKLLLSKGYIVHGTVRKPGDEKYAHLMKFEGASEKLKLFKADLLSYESIHSAIVGCSAVFHVACPVPAIATTFQNPEVEMVEPAVKGTSNVLEASLEAKVERVVYVSSSTAIINILNLPNDKVIDESYWSDKEYCRKIKDWYAFSKTEAEEQALDFAERTGIDLVRICPTVVLGPILQSTSVNVTTLSLLNLLKGYEPVENKLKWIIDVRDLADALLLAYEKIEAQGRYICTSCPAKPKDLVHKLKSLYPNYNYPTKFIEVDYYIRLSSQKLEKLGWRYRPLEETLNDSVESFKEIIKDQRVKKMEVRTVDIPDECWDLVFRFLADGRDLKYVSTVCKLFLSLSSQIQHSLKIFDQTVELLPNLFLRFPKLKALELSYFSGNLEGLLNHISQSGLEFDSLNLSNQMKLPIEGFRELGLAMKNLRVLICSNIGSLDDRDLEVMATCFLLLQELDITFPLDSQASDFRKLCHWKMFYSCPVSE